MNEVIFIFVDIIVSVCRCQPTLWL